jgi:hypothetical protein
MGSQVLPGVSSRAINERARRGVTATMSQIPSGPKGAGSGLHGHPRVRTQETGSVILPPPQQDALSVGSWVSLQGGRTFLQGQTVKEHGGEGSGRQTWGVAPIAGGGRRQLMGIQGPTTH